MPSSSVAFGPEYKNIITSISILCSTIQYNTKVQNFRLEKQDLPNVSEFYVECYDTNLHDMLC